MDANPCVLTIGHSTHAADRFIELLKQNHVTAIADIRSAPYSRQCPEFNREHLQRFLLEEHIAYVFLGRELGGRSTDPSCYEKGRIQYAKLAQTPAFKDGLDRVIKGAYEYRIALLCAERDPLACHRSLLVSRELDLMGAKILHIHGDGSVEAQDAAVERLLMMFNLEQPDMFRTKEERVDAACAKQAERIAYVDQELREAPTS